MNMIRLVPNDSLDKTKVYDEWCVYKGKPTVYNAYRPITLMNEYTHTMNKS